MSTEDFWGLVMQFSAALQKSSQSWDNIFRMSKLEYGRTLIILK